MPVTTEERVRKLEARVEHLEVFSGPGQMAALSANVTEVRTLVTDLKKQVDRLEKRIDARLDGVEARLDGVGTRLDGVDTQLQEHTGLLAEILRRLPKPADPNDN
jgi:uncharacterized coiled-coil protein SlyX